MFFVVLFDPQGCVWVMVIPVPNPSFPKRYADMLSVSPVIMRCSSFVHFVWDLVWDGFRSAIDLLRLVPNCQCATATSNSGQEVAMVLSVAVPPSHSNGLS